MYFYINSFVLVQSHKSQINFFRLEHWPEFRRWELNMVNSEIKRVELDRSETLYILRKMVELFTDVCLRRISCSDITGGCRNLYGGRAQTHCHTMNIYLLSLTIWK